MKVMKALELKGHIDDLGNLILEKPLDISDKDVRVIILIPEEDDISDQEWLEAASTNEAFYDLMDEEDIYSLQDGEAFLDEV